VDRPELEKLEGYLQRRLTAPAAWVFITGEPGIAKQSLSDEFFAPGATRFRVYWFPWTGASSNTARVKRTCHFWMPSCALEGPGRERLTSLMRTLRADVVHELPAAFASTGLREVAKDTIGATKERMMREMAMRSNVCRVLDCITVRGPHWADLQGRSVAAYSPADRHSTPAIAGNLQTEDIERSNHPLKGYKAEMQAHTFVKR